MTSKNLQGPVTIAKSLFVPIKQLGQTLDVQRVILSNLCICWVSDAGQLQWAPYHSVNLHVGLRQQRTPPCVTPEHRQDETKRPQHPHANAGAQPQVVIHVTLSKGVA